MWDICLSPNMLLAYEGTQIFINHLSLTANMFYYSPLSFDLVFMNVTYL